MTDEGGMSEPVCMYVCVDMQSIANILTQDEPVQPRWTVTSDRLVVRLHT